MFKSSQAQQKNAQNTPRTNPGGKNAGGNDAPTPKGNVQANILQRNVQQIQELQKELEELRNSYNQLEKQSSDTQDKLCKERDELRSENVRLQNSLQVLQAELNTLQNKKDSDRMERIQAEKQVSQELESRLNKLQLEYDQIFKELNEQKKLNFNLTQDIQQYKQMYEQQESENQQLLRQLDEMQTEIEIYEGKQSVNKSQKEKKAKVIRFDEDDEPEINNQQSIQVGNVQQQQLQRAKSTPAGAQTVDPGKVAFAFEEAKRTINDLQERIKTQRDEAQALRKQLEQERVEQRDEIEELNRQLENKQQTIDDLQQQLIQMGADAVQDEAFMQMQKKAEQNAIQSHDNNQMQQPLQINQSQLNEPMPVYHSLVNPSSTHNARKEYSLVKNDNTLLRAENEMLRKRLEKYEQIGVENLHYQQQMRKLIDVGVERGNAAALINKQLQDEKDIKEKFDQEALDLKLKTIKNQSSHAGRSFFTSIREKSMLAKSKLAADQSIPVEDQSNPEVLEKTQDAQDTKSLIEQQIQETTHDELKEEYKRACEQIEQYEQQLQKLEGCDQQVEILQEAVNQLKEDNNTLKAKLQEKQQALQDMMLQVSAQPESQNKPDDQQEKERKMKASVKLVDKGVQWGLSTAIPMISREVQTHNLVDNYNRARPMLISNDGLQYVMDTNQLFTILNKNDNYIDKYYKIVRNIVMDDHDNKVDFNGTYKDNRGIFTVVHGVIDVDSLRGIDDFTSRQNYGDAYFQMQVTQQEIKRVEAENKSLIEQLQLVRQKLADIQGKTVEQVILEGIEYQDGLQMQYVDAMVQTDGFYPNYPNQQMYCPYPQGDAVQQLASTLNNAIQQANLVQRSYIQPQPTLYQQQPVQYQQQPQIYSQQQSPLQRSYGTSMDMQVQTDLYVVPLDKYAVEKEKSNQYCRQNSELQIQLREFNKIRADLEQKQKEYQAAVKHIATLNEQLNTTQNENLALKQQAVHLQGQIDILLKNKDNYSDIFIQTNQAQQEMFDNLRQRLGQKDAQIKDLQDLLQRQREDNLRHVQQLTTEIEKLKRFGDDFNQLQVNNLKQELINQENQLVNQMNQNQFRQKLLNFDNINQSVEQELRNAKSENKKLRKAGEMIKEAFLKEQNKAYAIQQLNQKYKNSLVILFKHHEWPDLEIYINNDDKAIGLENQIIERLGGQPVLEQIETSKDQIVKKTKVKKVRKGDSNVGYSNTGE